MNLTLPPTSSALPDLRRTVAQTLGDLDQEVVADVLLALDEAVSNAIRHGSRGGEQVLVTVESDDEWVEMTVRDGGPTPRLPGESRERSPVTHHPPGGCECMLAAAGQALSRQPPRPPPGAMLPGAGKIGGL